MPHFSSCKNEDNKVISDSNYKQPKLTSFEKVFDLMFQIPTTLVIDQILSKYASSASELVEFPSQSTPGDVM
jgi:hypothetical protein